MKMSNILAIVGVGAVLAIGVGAVISNLTESSGKPSSNDPVIPKFSEIAMVGQKVYGDNCAICQGVSGIGTDSGPPLVHPIYNPGHHSDESFLAAVRRGVQQHHWRFGNMPAQSQVTSDQIKQLTQYVRELQQANGIDYQPHRM